MKILALDCATVTGWATNAAGGLESGTQRFEQRRGESSGMRFVRFRQWLGGLLESLRPELVIYEQPKGRMQGQDATRMALGLSTRVEELASAAGVEYRGVAPQTLKRYATGHGNAPKPAMLAAAAVRFPGREIEDDNEADALLLLAWGEAGMPETEPARRRK